jgi:hypothetical protein
MVTRNRRYSFKSESIADNPDYSTVFLNGGVGKDKVAVRRINCMTRPIVSYHYGVSRAMRFFGGGHLSLSQTGVCTAFTTP